jgi:hypothetical protein
VNPLPFIAAIIIVVGAIALASQQSWIGQLLTKGPAQEDPMANVSPLQARTEIETQIQKGLTVVGAKGTFKYTAGGADSTKNAPGAVELAVDIKGLKDPNQRHAIFDPCKDYMGPGKVTTMTINDVEGKTTRTWTYTCPLQTTRPDDAMPNLDTDTSTNTSTGGGAQPSQEAQ